jgi:hypothetical protein
MADRDSSRLTSGLLAFAAITMRSSIGSENELSKSGTVSIFADWNYICKTLSVLEAPIADLMSGAGRRLLPLPCFQGLSQ